MRCKTGSFERLDGNHPQIEVCRKEREGESYLLVRSAKRVAKDKAIRERFSLRIESELTKLAASVAARKVKAQKARERIGRIRQRNQRASRYFVTVLSENDGELKLTWGIDEQKLADAQTLDGVYILKTDRTDLESDKLWSLYMMLQRVERSFRYLKSNLGIRPIYHQLQHRSDGHIFISILAYHLLHSIEQMLLAHGDHRSWPTIHEELQTQRMLTVSVEDTLARTHHIRLTTRSNETQAGIYQMLNVNPKPLPTKRYVVDPAGSDENEDAVLTTYGFTYLIAQVGLVIDNSVKCFDIESQASLAEYISRPLISLQKLRHDPMHGRILWHTKYNQYFRQNVKMMDGAVKTR